MKTPGWWAVGIMVTVCGCRHAEIRERSLTPVKVRPVGVEKVAAETRYSANIAPLSQVTVAFRVGGYVERILQVGGRNADEGDVVTRGTVLAVLRQTEYETKVSQAKAQAAQARAGLAVAKAQIIEAQVAVDQAQLDFTRAKNLFSTQSLTKPEYDGAKAKLDGAAARLVTVREQTKVLDAQIAAAEQVVRETEQTLADSLLKAPMTGVVMKRMVEVGTLVGSGTAAFGLADLGSVKAIFGVPDTLVQSLRKGMAMRVETDAAPMKSFPGRVTNVSASADIKSRVFDVEVTIANQGNLLKPGMVAAVTIPGEGGLREELILPLSSIVRSTKNAERYAVYVAEEAAGKTVVRMREVTLGKTVSSGVVVTEGVRQGERVVTSGSTLVSEGETVQLAR